MTTGNAEIVQSAGNLHQLIGNAVLGQTQSLFDNATTLDAGDGVLNDDADTGAKLIEQLVAET
jgi:hypothetical protein